ncbi:replication factor C small subunit [Methanomicrobium sp. W14]|uniref:AAA family ATPase n=1 Tax=Methanomicrobium sp. W14 TaxID=2817839 RepID=UPI001AE65CDB|nr:AAA family ATPase [Methanomicrobium sp. W14]MBP2132235.1 replication factor C small subunit [Methanomicrobium sp. W14]
MLWIEKYRPDNFDDICGQDKVKEHLKGFSENRNIPHMLFFGPHGTGKSVSVEAVGKEVFGDDYSVNVSVIPAGTLFRQGKAWLENEEKFSHLYQKEESLISNFKHIVKWYASMKPFNAEFKIVVFEDAGELSFDAQAALRRIMEKYSKTCRFVLVSRQQTAIIPPVASRCLPLFFSPLDTELISDLLKKILEKEGILPGTVTDDEIELIAGISNGDCRKAITYLQVSIESGGDIDPTELSDSETSAISSSLFSSLQRKDFKKSCETAEMLMIEYGLSGKEVIQELSNAAKREYNDKRIAIALSDADYMMCSAGNEFIQINALLSRIIAEVFN